MRAPRPERGAPTTWRDGYWTPPEVLERVRRVGPIGLDPCTGIDNPCGARLVMIEPTEYLAPAGNVLVDGLAGSWLTTGADGTQYWWRWVGLLRPGEVVYSNPPYSRGNLGRWTGMCRSQGVELVRDGPSRDGPAGVIALVPVDTSTAWWADNCEPGCGSQAVCFWHGRLKYGGGVKSADFPSAVAYWGPRKHAFAAAFEDAGAIWLG